MDNIVNDVEVKKEIISYFGECIFPQSKNVIFDLFGENVLGLIAEGYISTSRSKAGIHPTMMKRVQGYLELTNKGWEYFDSLENKKNEQ